MRALLALLVAVPAWAAFSITSPVAASTVSGAMTFTVTDVPTGTTTVEYTYDGWRSAGLAVRPPWSVVAPAGTEYMDGARSLVAVAKGADGATLGTTASVAFTVNNFGGTGFSFSTAGTSGTITITLAGKHGGTPTVTCMVDGWATPNPPTLDFGNTLDLYSDSGDSFRWAAEHALAPGDPVYYEASTAPISGLSHQSTYYAVPVDKYTFRVASSRVNALAGTYLTLGAVGSGQQKFTRLTGVDRWVNNTVLSPTFDSTRLPNGDHIVTCNEWGSTTDNTFWHSDMNPVATYSATVTTANEGAPMELRGPARIHMLTSDSAYPEVIWLANVDGTTTAIDNDDADWFSSDTSVFTVTNLGIITPVGAGRAWLRIRYSNASYVLDVPVTVRTASGFPHFSKGGTVLTSYNSATSHFVTNLFELASSYWADNASYDLSNSGAVTASEGLPPDIHTNTSTFAAWWSAFFSPIETRLNTYSLGSLWIGDNLMGTGLVGVQKIINNASVQSNLDTALTDMKNSGAATFIVVKDEVNSTFKSGPQYVSTWSTGRYPFSSISVAAGVLTMNYIGFPTWSGLGPTGLIAGCITGAATSGLNGCYLITAKDRTTVTMTKTAAANGTYNSGTDPDLRFTAWQDYEKQETGKTITASGGSCSAPMTSASANGWAVSRVIGVFGNPADTDLRQFRTIASLPDSNTIQWACADVSDGTYTGMTIRLMWAAPLQYDALQSFVAQFDATANHAPLGWPIEGTASNEQLEDWETVASYTDLYSTHYNATGTPLGYPAYEFHQRITTPTKRHSVRAIGNPLVAQTNGVFGDYQKKTTAGDWPRWDTDLHKAPATRADMIPADVWGAIAQGAAGVRGYFFDKPSKQAERVSLAVDGSQSIGINPLWTPDLWRGYGLAFTAAQRFKELALSPQITAPYMGFKFITGARQAATSRMLVVASVSDRTESVTVDTSAFAYGGGSVALWKISSDRIAVSSANSSSDTVSLSPGEVAVYLFSAGLSPLKTYTIKPPLASGAASTSVRYATWPRDVRELGTGLDCGASACAILYDPSLPLYAVFSHVSAGGAVVAESSITRLN